MTGKVDVVATLARVDEATAGRSHQDLVWIGTVVPSFPPSHLGTPLHRAYISAALSLLHGSEMERRATASERRCSTGLLSLQLLLAAGHARCPAAQAGGRPLPRLPPADPPPLVASPEPRARGLGSMFLNRLIVHNRLSTDIDDEDD